MAAGLQQAFRSDGMTKPLHAGRAAEGGLLAARLGKAGFTGSGNMLSGPAGFVKAMSHGRDISTTFADLFEDWTIARSTYKRYAACGHAFAAVDSIVEILREGPIDPAQIVRVDVATYTTAIEVAGISRPTSAFEAKFSIPFCVAATLLGHDLCDLAVFQNLCANADVHALARRVTLVADSGITAAFPQLRGARVAIHLANGDARSYFTQTRKGEPTNPLSAEELENKFRRLVGATRHAGRIPDLIDWVKGLAAGGALMPEDLPLASDEPFLQAAQ